MFVAVRLLSREQSGNNLAISRRCYKPMYVAPYLRELKRRKDVQLKKLGDFSTPRSKYIEWNLQAEIYAFGKRLGEEFDQELLKRAFTHKSYIQQELEQRKSLGIEDSSLALEDNEEFIKKGDRIVSDTVVKYIKNALPRASTVFHKSLETYLCSTATLATSSNLIGSKDIILSNEYPPSEELLANTFKAIVFALEESSGIEKARQFVVDLLIVQIAHKDIYEIWNPKNPMGIVCEELESQKRALPESRLMRQTGGNTILGVFQVGLYSNRKLIGQGFGETPEIAETMSAHDALRKMYGLEEKMLPLPFGKKAERLVL
ncbi:hypothetical protein QYM36_011862 [Artemia franciscana]|uniref:Large ribosomal subunit protein mL44 n=2 Tax=Artemia franciscana TaxID=6661 RepID=A0AA88L262_ARTSF|nr:hypothetical protein QYM36_011862 [Artemia franciscana]